MHFRVIGTKSLYSSLAINLEVNVLIQWALSFVRSDMDYQSVAYIVN